MQSLFDPNPHSRAEVKHSVSPVRLIIFLLVAIFGVGGWGVYRYERELERQKQERCDKARAELFGTPLYGQTTRGVKEACGTERLTPEEKAEIDKRQAEVSKSNRESECEDAFQRYGLESEVTKQHCTGTELGKKMGLDKNGNP